MIRPTGFVVSTSARENNVYHACERRRTAVKSHRDDPTRLDGRTLPTTTTMRASDSFGFYGFENVKMFPYRNSTTHPFPAADLLKREINGYRITREFRFLLGYNAHETIRFRSSVLGIFKREQTLGRFWRRGIRILWERPTNTSQCLRLWLTQHPINTSVPMRFVFALYFDVTSFVFKWFLCRIRSIMESQRWSDDYQTAESTLLSPRTSRWQYVRRICN